MVFSTSAGEGIAGRVVVQDEAGAAADRVEGFIGSQVGSGEPPRCLLRRSFSAGSAFTAATMLAAGFAAAPLGNLLGCHCAVAGVPAVHDAVVAGAAEDHAGADQGRQDRPGQERPLHQLPAYHHSTPFVKHP